ncbi:MarR family winged helix-turn-helix transcriptional regulator [Alkalihalophilus sp. As8PL]|uniref:MarR family winged helix-turn-helix transcriptional regulator n=1 Tax=Alkalihalophilus sp. As8PL TaxID=3237103 RepID=A0AB39BZP4_9BACI
MKIETNLTLFHRLHQISRLLTKRANQALQPFDLYSAQWTVIYTLKTKGTLTQRELCEYLAVEAPPLTRNVQRLVKKGLVRQICGKDKRTKRIELTEEAHLQYPTWERAMADVKQQLMEGVSADTEEQLDKLLVEWLSTIEQETCHDQREES